jgi:hypothetical protein
VGKLGGTLTAATVNGVATFPDLKIDKPGNSVALTASSSGLSSAASPPFNIGPGAGILREWWTGLAGRSLPELAGLSTQPTGREVLGKALEVPVNTVSNYGARFRGFLLPPLTGSYVFWVANEVASELWLSTNQTVAAKVRIVEVTDRTPYSKWPHTHEAQSVPVNLVAGKRYYLEVLQKPGGGATQLCVRWRLPNGVEERPIPGARLAPPSADSQ